MTEKETKTENFDDLESLKMSITKQANKAKTELDKYNAFVNSAFGEMPRTQVQLVEFIEKVLAYHKVIKDG